MENEVKTKAVWQKPEIVDFDIELTAKILYKTEDGPLYGAS